MEMMARKSCLEMLRHPILRVMLVVLALVCAEKPAEAGPYTVIRSFPIGESATELGYAKGDTSDVVPQLEVGRDGSFGIRDTYNDRIMALAPDGSIRFVTPEPPRTTGMPAPYPKGVLPLTGGDLVSLWGGPTLEFRLYGSDGVVRARAPGRDVRFVAELPAGNFVAEMSMGTSYLVFDRSLKLQSTVNERPLALGRSAVGGDAVIVVDATGCFAYPYAAPHPGRIQLLGDVLVIGGGNAIGRMIRGSSSMTVWAIPNEEFTPWVNGRREVTRDYYEPLPDASGASYSLVVTPDHFEIVRWNLAELPSQAFTLPAATSLGLNVSDKTISVGQDFDMWIEPVGGKGRATVGASNLPAGANMNPRVAKGAVLTWIPASNQAGLHSLTFTAEDEYCQRASQTITITVNP